MRIVIRVFSLNRSLNAWRGHPHNVFSNLICLLLIFITWVPYGKFGLNQSTHNSIAKRSLQKGDLFYFARIGRRRINALVGFSLRW